MMANTTQRTSSLYAALLLAYPRDFRTRFGEEMTETFSDQMLSAWTGNGLAGAIRVWLCAIWEIISIAAPLQLRSSVVLSLFLSLLASSAVCLAFFVAVTPHCAK
jgi:hypothetical protein